MKLTEYDTFLAVAGRKEADVELLKKSLWLDDDAELQKHLQSLVSKKLLILKDGQYSHTKGEDAEALLKLLLFALAYGYDYNVYLSEAFQQLLFESYSSGGFGVKALPPDNAGRDLMLLLMHDNFVLNCQYSPLLAVLVHNLFFDMIVEYRHMKPKSSFFKSKPKINSIIFDKEMQIRKENYEQVSTGGRYFFYDNKDGLNILTPKVQKILQYDLVREHPEQFDTTAQTHLNEAKKLVNENSADYRRTITVDMIKSYHRVAMTVCNCPSEFRDHEVVIRNNPSFSTVSHKQVPKKIDEFIEAINKLQVTVRRKAPEAAKLAAWTYNEFLHIHPFADGNSRVALLLSLHVLNISGTAMRLFVPPSYDYRFIQVSKSAKKRNDDELAEVFNELRLLAINKVEYAKMLELI